MRTEAIGWSEGGAVRLLDQTALPGEIRYLELDSVDAMVEAIRTLRVRGAPLIGIAAAMSLAAEAARRSASGPEALDLDWLADAARRLVAARPTAVNLGWALDRMRRVGEEALRRGQRPAEVARRLRAEAEAIWDEDAESCQAIARHGSRLVPAGSRILTHCNTGQLATGGIGTALGVIVRAHQEGKGIRVLASETRPLGQGLRLTAWELARAGIPYRVIADGAAGWLMARGEVDLVITGADRIAANGDVANKIGTYSLAVLARAHGIPFYVAAPLSSFDLSLESGQGIPIEHRAPAELTGPLAGVEAENPAFDVTPGELVSGLITDRGVLRPPYPRALAPLRDSSARAGEPGPPTAGAG